MANLLVLVSYKVFPSEFGGQKTVSGFYDQLCRHHSIYLVASADNEPVEKPYPVVKILHPNKKMLWNIFNLFRLKKICEEHKIGCVIAEHSYAGWLAYLLKKMTGLPFIIRSHNMESSRFRQMGRGYWKLYDRYEKWIHRKADRSFFITEDDKKTAVQQYGLNTAQASVIPYGISKTSRMENANQKLAEIYGLTSEYIFYFNGTLDYQPNTKAVVNLFEKVNPLLQLKEMDYTIVISGKNLREEIAERIKNARNIVYIGYAKDAALLYQASSVFLNPVINNSGIKTKIVEALANDCSVVSMEDGAQGIPDELHGGKLVKVQNGNWPDFVESIVSVLELPKRPTPNAFFKYFSAERIAQNAADEINFLVHGPVRK